MQYSKHSQVVDTIKKCHAFRVSGPQSVTPYLVGPVGIGKTSLPIQAANDLDIDCQILLGLQYDAGELRGLIYMGDDGQTHWARPDMIPEEGEGILVLDELGQYDQMQMKIMAQLVNDRRIGEHKLGDGWSIVATGNEIKHKAGVNPIPSHLKDRLMYLYMEAVPAETIAYMAREGVDDSIIGYLQNRPEMVAQFDKAADSCPSPRSWHKVNTLLGMGFDDDTLFKNICGTVGEPAAIDFKVTLEVFRAIGDPKDGLKNPDTARVDFEPSIMFAVMSACANAVDADNVENFCKYVLRIPARDVAAFGLMMAMQAWPALYDNKFFRQWMAKEGKELYRPFADMVGGD